MENPGIVSVLNALMASGLEGFLGCPAVIYESELVDFFTNGSVRDGLVVSIVNGVPVEFSERLFAEIFELPVDGLADLSDMPKDKIFDARSIVSLSGEPVSLSGRKGQMKIEYRLLCDIMAKSISVKAGSFNALTVEKFSLLTAVVCGIRMNWASILFNILKKMVSAGSKQAKGFAVQISLLLESIPNLELGESTEFPASKILTDKTVHRYISFNDKVGVEEADDAPPMKKAPRKPAVSTKRPAIATTEEPVPKKKRTSKKKSGSSSSPLEIVVVAQEAVSLQMVEPFTGVPTAEEPAEQPTAGEDISADQPVDKVTGIVGIEEWAVERLVATPDDTDEEFEAERPVFESVEAVAPVVEVCEAATDKDFLLVDDPDTVINQVLHQLDSISADKDDKSSDRAATWFDSALDEMLRNDEGAETMDKLLEDILLTIPVDVPLPSAGMEITKIKMGKEIKITEVDERTWFLNSLPKTPADNKGKAILVEKDPVKGNPAKEHFSLTCADIDMLVNLRAQVIDDVDQFFNSFRFKKLAAMNLEGISAKGEQVLLWGETENIHVSLARKKYILLKYRAVLVRKFLDSWKNNFVPGQGSSAVDLRVIDLLSDLHLFVLEELTKEARAHGLSWKKTSCSKIFEGNPCDRGAVITRSNTNTRSSCWIRTMIRVNGTWVIEPCADNNLFRVKSIASANMMTLSLRSRRLLPVGSVNFCRGLPVGEPVFRVAPRQSPVFALRVSQFCSVFIDFSLFSWLPTADITDFLSSIALDRTAFRSVQIAQNTVSVAPSVQMLDEPSSSDSSSDDILMDFADQDTTDAANSLPAATTPDVTNALNQLRASIDQIRERDDDGAKTKDTLLLHLSNFENQVIARLDAQDRVLGALRKASNDQRNLLSLELQSSHKQLGAQIVTKGLDVVEVRRVVKETHQEHNAKINSLDEQVAATRNYLLEFSAQAQQTLSIITNQLSELVAYVNRGGDAKKGEGSSSCPQPPPSDLQNLESRQFISLEETAERIREADRRQAEAERERERQRRIRRLRGSSKRRRY
ncbi:dystroglycan-like [Dorcoceras hygrometricum]|uniref:Dystroglycan-like n=1 Tax=Dorcoceras hygrometricum TaxID=472368 RepID=A0A2Z7BQ38_9LAMI|nr:dystroglycan-like [Dorcoceras hygrometricum]